MSAVGYLTGAQIQKTVGVPVGLIDISWGGCRIESMTTLESMKKFKSLEQTAKSTASQIADMMKDFTLRLQEEE